MKYLNSDNKRLLIADEVGLGKTIEAGYIMLELKARNEFRNVLVVCPMSLKEEWATELNDKFGLEFINIDKKEQLIQELTHHNGTVRAVINYDKIRDTSEVIKYIQEKNIKFSLIVCDESRKLRNDETHIYKGSEQLSLTSDSVVFMSATPKGGTGVILNVLKISLDKKLKSRCPQLVPEVLTLTKNGLLTSFRGILRSKTHLQRTKL